MSTFFISDTHFSHKNICRGVSTWESGFRDFSSLNEMDSCLINNINKHVSANDILYHLGDFAFGGYDNIRQFRDMINCKTNPIGHRIISAFPIYFCGNAVSVGWIS